MVPFSLYMVNIIYTRAIVRGPSTFQSESRYYELFKIPIFLLWAFKYPATYFMTR